MKRTGTYVAFDGQGVTDPSKSDMKYYGLLQAWDENNEIDFKFSDSHKKTYQLTNAASLETIKNRLLERLSASKNMIVLISNDTNYDRGLLNWEIEQAVDVFKLPLVIAYVDSLTPIYNPEKFRNCWPKALRERIYNNSAKCIHTMFKKELILYLIKQFSVVDNIYPHDSLTSFTEKAYSLCGIL